MMALVLLGAAVAYIAFWFFIARLLPNWWARSFAILVALAIPFWDVPYGYYNFRKHCFDEGGLKILAPIPAQHSIYFASGTGYPLAELSKRGFQVVEIRKSDGKSIDHYRLLPNGKVESATISSATSRFGIQSEVSRRLPWGLVVTERALFAISENRQVARIREFGWASWLQWYAMPVLGQGCDCQERLGADSLLTLVLKGSDKP